MTKNRPCSLEELEPVLAKHRAAGCRIVHCHGVFDLLHVGHVRHLEQAKKLGDILVVTLTPDRYVNKGLGRPAFSEPLRAEVIASLDCVDYCAVNQWPTAVEAIRLLRPHVFVKGSEFRDLKDTVGHVAKEREAVLSVGGEIAFTEDITFSSSALINQYMSQLPPHVQHYLAEVAGRYSAEEVLGYLRDARGKKVLLIGETIIDEYVYCEAIGKAGKEPVLVTKYLSADRFGGGVVACANHTAGFCDTVDVLTFLGADGDREDFVRKTLKPNVNPILMHKKRSPTIVKQRFVEKYLSQKLFEVYHINDEPLDDSDEEELCGMLQDIVPRYDIVIVADYGHGMLGPRAVETLCRHAKFLAVNTQSNAGNHGFNMISKYPHADYVCLAQREFALETRNQRMSPEQMITHVADKLGAGRLLMTQGKYGSLFYTATGDFKQVPAFATQVVDRVGAGDAVLCLTSLCVASGAPAEVVAFLGNVVGAEAVTILGNQRAIERIPLYRHVECLLKVHQPMSQRLGLAGQHKVAA